MFPGNAAERALQQAYQGGKVSQFLDVLARGELWVPLPPSSTDPAEVVPLPMLALEGQAYVAVFTSQEQLTQSAGDVPYLASPAQEFARSLPSHVGMAVNIGGEVGLPLQPDGVAYLAGLDPFVRAGTRVRVGHPAQEPTDFLEELHRGLSGLSSVRRAYRAWVQLNDRAPGLVIGVHGERLEQPPRSVLQAVGRAAQRVPVPFAVDVILDTPEDEIFAWMRQNTEPFYTAAECP